MSSVSSSLCAQSIFAVPEFRDSSSKELFLDLEAASFFKNNEYTNDFTRGFTGLGYMFEPGLKYYATKDMSIRLGVFLQQYSGIDAYSSYIPNFTIDYKMSDQLRVVLGNIYGNLSHNLEESLFRFDRYYQDHLESGVQFLWNSDVFEADLWLDWKEFIFDGDDKQEEFQIGFVSETKIYDNGFRLSLPVQLLMTHKGGEIDISPDPVLSILNASGGLSIAFDLNSGSSIEFEPLFLWYKGVTLPDQGVNAQIFEDGTAYYLRLHYQNKFFRSSLSYWNADGFISPYGESLFMSVSDHIADYSEKERELLKFEINGSHKISDVAELALRLDMYYDLKNEDLAHAVGLYLIFNEAFLLKKLN